MKAEKFSQKCPKCGSKDKDLSEVQKPTDLEKLEKIGITKDEAPTAVVCSIRCADCGYLFEYSKGKCPVDIKKIDI
ncbi:MAG: TIGR04165 family Cys-rich peptide [Methanobacteriaceae archaeon]